MPQRGENDRYWSTEGGTIIVRAGGNDRPWLLTWLPNKEDDPAYPGVTMSSTLGEVPAGPTVHDVANWAFQQPWTRKLEEPPEEAAPIDVPAEEWAELQKKAFEHEVRLAFTPEPDGKYSWGLLSENGEVLQHGIADSWDDTRLAMIENLYPPSDET